MGHGVNGTLFNRERPTMNQLVMRFEPQGTNDPCGLCQKPTSLGAGLRLTVAQTLAPVCRGCAKKHAPPLAALADLARTAERVGRIGRHTVFPPLASLLDLAHAAENYLDAKPKNHCHAA